MYENNSIHAINTDHLTITELLLAATAPSIAGREHEQSSARSSLLDHAGLHKSSAETTW
jgi:hypothetical protein